MFFIFHASEAKIVEFVATSAGVDAKWQRYKRDYVGSCQLSLS